MNWTQAIRELQEHGERRDEALTMVYAAVAAKSRVRDEGDGEATNLADWLLEGDYSGDETPESLAAEWDALGDADNA